jgi:predicted Mrr-cat superfamily restriction endonuclease
MAEEERPIWGIHMGRDHGSRPIDGSYIAIGWSHVGDLAKISNDREAFKAIIAKTYLDIKKGAIPVVAGTLYKFAYEMRPGDRVVYPSKIDRKINLGFLDSSYFYTENGGLVPNRRKVRWIKLLDRTEFSQSALYEIGSAVTLFQVRSNAEEFLAQFENRPFEIEDVDATLSAGTAGTAVETTEDFILKRLKQALNLISSRNLSPICWSGSVTGRASLERLATEGLTSSLTRMNWDSKESSKSNVSRHCRRSVNLISLNCMVTFKTANLLCLSR